MNDVGTIGLGSLAVEAVITILMFFCWLLRRNFAVYQAQSVLIVLGGLVCLLTLGFPAGQIFWRLGLTYIPKCFSSDECREGWMFSARWIMAAVLMFAAQIVLFMKSRPTQK